MTEKEHDSLSHPLLRLSPVRHNKSDYYYKEIIVEPRESAILKTVSKAFNIAQMPKKYLKTRKTTPATSKIRQRESQMSVETKLENCFRDWVDETSFHRQAFFTKNIAQKLKLEMRPLPSSEMAVSDTSKEE